MSTPDTLRTKRGHARFDDGVLRFEESVGGYARAMVRDYWGGASAGQRAILAGWLFAVVYCFVVLGWELGHGRWLLPTAVVVLVAAARLVGRFRGYRSVDTIELTRIQSVKATRGSKGLTRPRLEISFRADGEDRKRRLLLPSLYAVDGESAFKRAVAAFEARGIDVAGDRPEQGRPE